MSNPALPPLQQLSEHLVSQHNGSIDNILFYGSCLRSGNVFDGLVDLYLIVDQYSHFYSRRWPAIANWLLPPNVFYLEYPIAEQTLRCKVTVISSADFARGVHWFETYIWGRFTQPIEVIYSRNEHCAQQLQTQLRQATLSFLNRVLPRLPASGPVLDLWRDGIKLSYSVEWRAESADRAQELISADQKAYELRLSDCHHELRYPLEILQQDDALGYRTQIPATRRFLSRLAWPLRRVQGKTLSILRLLKALFTFEGGLDYIAWKLERHSGQKVEIPDRVRRYPLIFIWGLFYRLYRRGVIR